MSKKNIDTAPRNGSWFLVSGGYWQTNDQSHGMSNEGWVKVRYVEQVNSVDSQFRAFDDGGIKNPERWKEIPAPKTTREARRCIIEMHESLLAFRHPEFDLIKEGKEGEFDYLVKRILSISAPTIKEMQD